MTGRAALVALALLGGPSGVQAQDGAGGSLEVGAPVLWCEPGWVVTFYGQDAFPGRTADGTPTAGQAGAIAAASPALALGAWVWVEGFGVRRIADRGRLGPRHVDVLVPSTAEAVRLGRQSRTVCEISR